jgi:Holliday junction resolvase-like predicted endonuclease/Sec-independent protein translocase protein TatA
MSNQPLTYENVLEMIRETREAIQDISRTTKEQSAEFDRRMQEEKLERKKQRAEFDRQSKEVNKKISALGSRIGEIVENMVAGDNIVNKFQALGYKIVQHGRRVKFGRELGIPGEIDLLLEDGDIAILIEVKTTLETTDVREHVERLKKYRRCADAKGDKRRFVGAVAGAVVDDSAMNFAHENGMYVIVQSGEAVEILPVPEGFQAKEW